VSVCSEFIHTSSIPTTGGVEVKGKGLMHTYLWSPTVVCMCVSVQYSLFIHTSTIHTTGGVEVKGKGLMHTYLWSPENDLYPDEDEHNSDGDDELNDRILSLNGPTSEELMELQKKVRSQACLLCLPVSWAFC